MKKLLLLLSLLPLSLYTQEWDHSNWAHSDFYRDGKLLGPGSMMVLDVKCFGDKGCYALTMFALSNIEVFKFNEELQRWNEVYNGRWDPFHTPESEWPDIIAQPTGGNILNDSTIFIFYKDNKMFNIFNFKTEEYDTIQFHYDIIMDAKLKNNGYGIASTGNQVYTTKNNWRNYHYLILEYPSSAWRTPIEILPDYRFAIVDYYGGNCYFTVSQDGVKWDRHLVGNFYPVQIRFINKNIGFVMGGRIKNKDEPFHYDVISKTTDGGLSWNKVVDQYNDPSYGIQDLVFYGDSVGIAISQYNTVYTTLDQGKVWKLSKVEQIESHIFDAKLDTGDGKFYLLPYGQGIFSYDIELLGLTSVPIYLYKPLEVFPNPFVSNLIISGDDLQMGKYQLKLFSDTGKLILSQEQYIQSGTTLNLDVPSGAYYLLLEGDNYYYKRLIKE